MKVHIRALAAPAVAVAAVAVLAACGGGDSPPSAAATDSPTEADVTVTAKEFSFDPDAFDLTAGSDATIELVNGGTVEHDLTIDALNVTIYAGAGQTASATIPALDPGTYEFYCSIPGHREAGMVGELTVP